MAGENVLKRPIGPLPTWAWVAIVGGVIIGWAWWRNRQNAASSSQSSSADASQVPQFVNQTYTTVQPPSDDDLHEGNRRDHDGPPGVSRVHRSPKVKHQINQIHKEHEASQKHGKSNQPSGEVHKQRPPSRRIGPVRRG